MRGHEFHVGAGAVAGLLAGSMMALVAMIASAVSGDGFWFPLQLIGASVYGVNAILGGNGPAITGACIHLAISAGFGALYAPMVTPATGDAVATAGGFLYGFGVWAVMSFAVLPWLDPTLYARASLIPGWWLAYHLVFGATLGVTPELMHRSRRARRHEGPRERQFPRAA